MVAVHQQSPASKPHAGTSTVDRAERCADGARPGVWWLQVTQKNMGASGEGAKGAGRDGIMDLLVMENIFYGRATTRIYDLKACCCHVTLAGALANLALSLSACGGESDVLWHAATEHTLQLLAGLGAV